MRNIIYKLYEFLWSRKVICFLTFFFFCFFFHRTWLQVRRLLFIPISEGGANDLYLLKRHLEILIIGSSAIQFPATYILTIPVITLNSFWLSRVVMAVVLALSIFGLVQALSQWLKLKGIDKIFLALYLLTSYPVGITVGNGQWAITVIFLMLWSLFQLEKETSLWKDYLIILALLFSLIKPHCTAPFFWLILFRTGRFKIVALVSFFYFFSSALIMFGLNFDVQIKSTSDTWQVAARGLGRVGGYGNFHYLLGSFGYHRFGLPLAITTFFLFGVWAYIYRSRPLWLLIGIAGIYSRIWTYHRMYEDLLIIFPMVSLWYIVQRDKQKYLPKMLLFITAFSFLPASMHRGPYSGIARWGIFSYWVALMIFLMFYTHYYSETESCPSNDNILKSGDNTLP